MTTLTRDAIAPADARVPAVRVGERVNSLRRHLPDACAVLAVLGLVVVERQGAGMDGWSLVLGLVSVLPVLAATRAWTLPRTVLAVVAALPVSVLLVASLAPGGAFGVERGGAYAYGGLLALAALGWARTPARRVVATCALMLVVLDQFTVAWLPWWGSANPAKLMVGTFYWHNQFGAFCLGGAALALGLTHLASGRVRAVAVLVGAFCVVGVMLSGSRASLFALGVAWLVCLALGSRAHGVLRALGRTAVQAVAALAVGTLLVSPLFFPRWGLPWGPVGNRMAEGSLDGNTTARWEFWVAGMQIAADHPLIGPGLQTFGDMSRPLVPTSVGLSTDPHNELVRGFAEGGLVGGLPMLAVVLLAALVGLRSVPLLLRREALKGDPARWAALVGAGALVAHALVDFDWSYPALSAATGLALGIAGAPLLRAAPSGRRASRSLPWPVLGAVLLVAGVVGGLVSESLERRAQLAIGTEDVTDDETAWTAWAPDHRVVQRVLAAEIDAGRPTSGTADRAWTVLERRASVDAGTGSVVVELMTAADRHADAITLSRELVARAGDRSVLFALRHATALAGAGVDSQAADVAAGAVAQQAEESWHRPGERLAAIETATDLTDAGTAERGCVEAVEARLETSQGAVVQTGAGTGACAAFR